MEENKTGEVEIDVIVADASHEKYVDEILETISAAAKVQIGRASCRERV